MSLFATSLRTAIATIAIIVTGVVGTLGMTESPSDYFQVSLKLSIKSIFWRTPKTISQLPSGYGWTL